MRRFPRATTSAVFGSISHKLKGESKKIMKLKITCNTNPDIPGEWTQADVEQEMKEVGIEVKGNDEWLEYVLGHVFDEVELPKAVYDAIIFGDVQSIIFKSRENDVVKIVLTR